MAGRGRGLGGFEQVKIHKSLTPIRLWVFQKFEAVSFVKSYYILFVVSVQCYKAASGSVVLTHEVFDHV